MSNLEDEVPCIYVTKWQGDPVTPGSLFVGSYDSQSYGGGIRPRLHAGYRHMSPYGFPEVKLSLLIY
jgi:hypothetical protein